MSFSAADIRDFASSSPDSSAVSFDSCEVIFASIPLTLVWSEALSTIFVVDLSVQASIVVMLMNVFTRRPPGK